MIPSFRADLVKIHHVRCRAQRVLALHLPLYRQLISLVSLETIFISKSRAEACHVGEDSHVHLAATRHLSLVRHPKLAPRRHPPPPTTPIHNHLRHPRPFHPVPLRLFRRSRPHSGLAAAVVDFFLLVGSRLWRCRFRVERGYQRVVEVEETGQALPVRLVLLTQKQRSETATGDLPAVATTPAAKKRRGGGGVSPAGAATPAMARGRCRRKRAPGSPLASSLSLLATPSNPRTGDGRRGCHVERGRPNKADRTSRLLIECRSSSLQWWPFPSQSRWCGCPTTSRRVERQLLVRQLPARDRKDERRRSGLGQPLSAQAPQPSCPPATPPCCS